MKNRFPEFYKKTLIPKHKIFGDISGWNKELVLRELLDLISKEMELADRSDSDTLSDRFRALLDDIINAKASGILTPLQSDLLRLRMTSELAEYFSHSGRFSLCYNWLLCALTNGRYVACEGGESTENDFFLGRINCIFNSSKLDRIGDARKVVLLFFCSLYYYSWKASGLRELASLVLSQSVPVLLWSMQSLSGLNLEIALEACCQLSTWSEMNGREDIARTFIPLLEEKLSSQQLSPTSRKTILIQFSTITGKYSSRPPHEWAIQAIGTVRSNLIGHEYLQLLLASCADTNSPLINLPEIKKASRAYAKSIRLSSADQADFEYKQARLFEIIRPFIVRLSGSNNIQEALQIMGAWYDIEESQVRSQPLLSIIPNMPDTIWYAGTSKLIAFDRDSVSLLRRVTTAGNRCLGINITLHTDPTLQDFSPQRPGIPDPSAAREFEREIEEYYEFNKLSNLDDHTFDFISGLLLLQATQHPIQAVLRKILGKSWPIVTSYQEPMPDRRIEKILFLSMGTISADAEIEAVRNYFSHCEFIFLNFADKVGKQQFLDAYSSNEYDVIWIEGHGEFNPISPHQAHLPHSFQDDLSLSIGELQLRMPTSETRRLLVLNICSGGNVLQSSAPARLGIAAMLSRADQCVISHLWPIKSFVGATFGAALARSLAMKVGFFRSFEEALDCMRLSKEELMFQFSSDSQRPAILLERLENGADEFTAQNILNWGSPVFFE